MKRLVIVLGVTAVATAGLAAQQQRTPPPQTPPAKTAAAMPANPLTDSTKMAYNEFKGYLIKSAEQMKDTDYGFKPAGVVAEVRTFGQIVGHLADANLAFCGAVSTVPPPSALKDVEHTMKTKADLQKALGEAFAYCDKAWAATSDANAAKAAEMPFGLGKSTRLGVLAFNTSHDAEHYGNIVTYMRAKGLVPPSSQPAK
jgi:uncharacterized damage-inducible protein DinB